MTTVLDKNEFEREWQARQTTQVQVVEVEAPTVMRFVLQGFLEALIGFDDILGEVNEIIPARENQTVGRITSGRLRQISGPKTIRRKLLR